MSRYGDIYENKVTGERAVVLRGDEDGEDRSALVHLTVRPYGAVVGEHIHPYPGAVLCHLRSARHAAGRGGEHAHGRAGGCRPGRHRS